MGPSARCGSSHFEHLHVPPLGSTTEEPSADPSLVFAKAGALKRHKVLGTWELISQQGAFLREALFF